MLKSCKYCQRIHDTKFDCGKKPTYSKQSYKFTSFRNTTTWRNKSRSIRGRDGAVCTVCLTEKRITIDRLSVHHIDSLEDDYDRALDDYNLITLCAYHHELAECGKIEKKLLFEIARRNTDKLNSIN